ncbi:MAG: HpcH/HpaI aldolase/citrate lyase family protein [Polyangiaceae bacterium]|nr:HpcH/HpaI aldolase/citrate lyase family protein [Polyangiaceae bacterium]
MTVSLALATERVNAVFARLEESEPVPSVAGESHARRPVHVLYGGAHLFKAEAPAKLGKLAASAMETFGKGSVQFGSIVGAKAAFAPALWNRVRQKLASAPIDAMCIDFEDGYGPRPDAEEDADSVRAATELAHLAPFANAADASSPIVGIRVKALSPATRARSVRTLDAFLTTLVRLVGALPRGFTVTLPKVDSAAEVSALASLLAMLEGALGLPQHAVGIELMIESPRALVDRNGACALPALVAAAQGRAVAAHLGAYDLSAALGVTASEQRLDHPACDAARMIMQFALADTPVAVVDGATTLLPIGRHKAGPLPLTCAELADNMADVHAAWKLHAANVRHALGVGIYQGWDLHPAQIPARLGALYTFFLGEREAMARRLAVFVERATKATRLGQVFDDAATGQGLVNFFLRGLSCGALDEADVSATGLTLAELRSRSFANIVAARKEGTR